MIRLMAAASLVATALLSLYIAFAYEPQRLIFQLRKEHSQTAEFWGPARATNILCRALRVHVPNAQIVPSILPASATTSQPAASAVSIAMDAVNARLFESRYARSAEALLLLVNNRFFTLLEWTPQLLVFCFAAWVDAALVRSIKAKQLSHHDPEIFASCVAGAMVMVFGAMVAFVIPETIPPLVFPALPVGVALLVAAAIRNHHAHR